MMAVVKVCGVTRVADARLAVELGARFIGLNFYPPSPRAVAVERAREIAAAVRGQARVVGVFVNRPPAEVEEIAAAVGLDLLQFHGDESPAELLPFGRRAIKVLRTRGGEGDELGLEGFCRVWGFLFDIRHSTLYGGTGVAWRYGSVAGLVADRPFFVAGGIGPGNARQALAESGAFGIDVCSGVEASPGLKDPTLMEQLFREVGNV